MLKKVLILFLQNGPRKTNMLPDLPKKNKHKEADFGTKVFKEWVHNNAHLFYSCTFELKDSKGKDSILFSTVEPLQLDAGLSVKWSKKGYLIRNTVAATGTPDYAFYRNAPAYIVIKYPKFFVIIDVETFIEEKKRNKRKSLTCDRAKEISFKIVNK